MYDLSDIGIEHTRETVEQYLSDNKVEHLEVLRLCMMLEEALLNYRGHFGENTSIMLHTKKLLGRIQIVIRLVGESFDPFCNAEDEDLNLLRKLNADSTSVCVWTYKNGENVVSFSPRRELKLSSSKKTILAMVLAVVLGFICSLMPEAVRTAFLDNYLSPTLSMIMGIITAVAGPMIFFSLMWGVCTMGDVQTLSKIGKKMLGRFLLQLAALSVMVTLICYSVFHGKSGGTSIFKLEEFYNLLLGVIPNNAIAPFLNGNTQQIIFLSIVGGIVLLCLGERASVVSGFVGNMNLVVQYIMQLANKLIPFMVFLSIFKVVISGQFAIFAKAYKIIPVFLLLTIIIMAIYTLAVSVRHRVSADLVFKKAFPVFFIGLTTASSAAALSLNMSTCEEKFGIDKRIVSFGVPLGQTLFKPGAVLEFVIVGFCMANMYDVPITVNWLTVIAFTALLLTISAPPVAGGAAVCMTILFEQLGIPSEAIGFALAMDVIMDFVMTAVCLYCLEMELTGLAGILGMLDKEKLRNELRSETDNR